ncbi:hypothetical protein TL16_g07328 [Triparma laevis f. inornata]|uniref:Uncharacterized protein n=1 Tax=Triparma laevis f. inornata TaxID=1714386 RepID=A0A9W7EFQ5_9STRA|nr:hypothetical protein TL16_g07328 [Triparma laevis f. inornata]
MNNIEATKGFTSGDARVTINPRMDMSSRDVDATITYDAGNTNVELEANMDAQSIKVTQQVRRSGERSEPRTKPVRSEVMIIALNISYSKLTHTLAALCSLALRSLTAPRLALRPTRTSRLSPSPSRLTEPTRSPPRSA